MKPVAVLMVVGMISVSACSLALSSPTPAQTVQPPAQSALAPMPGLPHRNEALWMASQAEKPQVIETLRDIVSIETPTRELAGMAELGENLAARLIALGGQVERIPVTTASGGNIIIGRFAGTGQTRILLIAHMDTIHPAGTLARRPFRMENGRAYGPGIADDKGGIAVILHSIAVLKKMNFANFGEIVVLFNTDEESGSRASSAQITALANSSDITFSFEPSTVGTEIITLSGPGAGGARVTVQGRAAHAGFEPERGSNALVEASSIVMRTRDLDDQATGFRFNWTRMSSGTIGNQIPDSAVLSADVRHFSAVERDEKLAVLAERLRTPTVPGTTATMEYMEGRPGFVADAASRAWIERAVAIYAEVGSSLRIIPSAGGSTDAGYAQMAGKPVVEGLGLPGFGFHSSNEEYVDVDRIPARIYLAVQMIMEASR